MEDIVIELKKKKEKTFLTITEEDMKNKSDKLLFTLKRECVDFKTWFKIILYYYTLKDYKNFKKFSQELLNIDVDLNPYYKDQKQIFIYILNTFSIIYNYLSEKTNEATSYEELNNNSTRFINKAENIIMYDHLTMICKGFLLFCKGDYNNSETYFLSISENDKNNVHPNIVILANIGKALTHFNKGNYSSAINCFTILIKDHNYINENILECIIFYKSGLGICFFNSRKMKKAKEIFMKTLELNPKNPKVLTYIAILELLEYDTNNNDAYANCFEMLKQSYVNSEENNEFFLCILNLANLYLVSKKIGKAENICQKLNTLLEYGEIKFSVKETKQIKENKDKDKFRKTLDEIKSMIFCLNAKIFHYKKNINEAYSWYTKSLNANPKNLDSAFGLGQIHLEMYNFQEAQKCFELCKSLKNYNIEVEKNLAYIYTKNKKKQEEAIEMYKNAINFKKDSIDCYLELAQLLEFRAPDECLRLYEQVIDIIRSGNFKNSEGDFYIIKQIMPEILNNYAVVKLRLNNLQGVDSLLYEALQIVKKKIEDLTQVNQKSEVLNINENPEQKMISPKFKSLELSIYFNLALYYEAKNEFAEAYKYYKHIIKENPYFVDAYIKLGELAKLRGHEKKAIDYMKQALDKHFKKDAKSDLNPNARLLSMLPKPINPILNLAQIFFDSGNEQDAISYLKTILNEYDDKDIYTIIFLGNLHYEFAVNFRKGPTRDKDYNLKKSLEYYYKALELDKFNCYASIGISNILAEFNLTSFALDTYKKVCEKMPNNPNPFINEGILYMNENKYDHAIMTFNKILKRFFKNKNPQLELLISKNYISNKEFEKALKILKCLIFRYPDNIYYKFNYALCLRAKSEDILQKTERKVKQTQEAIRNLEKSIPIFESIKNLKKEICQNYHSSKEEKFFKTLELFSSCKDIAELSRESLLTSQTYLEHDIKKEEELNKLLEENKSKLFKIKFTQKELEDKERIDKLRKMEENDKIVSNLNDLITKMAESSTKEVKETKIKKKRKRSSNEKEDLSDQEHNADNSLDKSSDHDDEIEETEKKNRKKKKKVKKKKRRHEKNEENDHDEEENESQNDIPDRKKKRKKSKKLKKSKNQEEYENELNYDNINDDDKIDNLEEKYENQENHYVPKIYPTKNEEEDENNKNEDEKIIKHEGEVKTQIVRIKNDENDNE